MRNQFLGIDLGTTYSACAYMDDDGKPQIITNREGDNTTPSVVYLEDKDHIVVGQTAKENQCIYPGKVVSLVKNSMGKMNPDQTPVMVQTELGEYMPEAISSFILGKLVADANEKLGFSEQEIKDVVVTIPAYFNDAQRKATDNAISMAGLNRLGFINEPTAAALYYAKQTGIEEANILVYDLGGGTFDVSIIHIAGHAREVVSTKGLQKVGGSFFDREIVQRICEDYNRKHNIELNDPEYAGELQDLYGKAERAKIKLSSADSVDIVVRVGSEYEKYEITREDFEEIVGNLYKKTEACIRTALKDASLTVDQIDKVILVGGCSRIPYIQKRLEEYFGKKPCMEVNPDEVVALGAAIYAGQLKEGKDVEITDVNSHSIGIRAFDAKKNTEFNDILIKRNTSLPANVEKCYILKGAEMKSLFINVFEGEYKEISDVSEICAVDVDIPVDIQKETRVFIRLEVDKYQILHLYVRLPEAGNIEKEIIFERKSNISESQVSEWKKSNAEAINSVAGKSKKKSGFFTKLFGGERDQSESETEDTDASVQNADELIMPKIKKTKEEAKKADPTKKIPPVVKTVMQDVIGMDEVGEAMRDFKNRLDMQQKRLSFAHTDEFNHCIVIYGKPGIGLTTAAKKVAACLYKFGMVANENPVIATYDDIVKKDEQGTVAAIQNLFQSAMNGILIIDDFHRFQDDNEMAAGMQAVELLQKAYVEAKRQVTLIIAGYAIELKALMDVKPKFARLFVSNSIELMGYSAEEYVRILHMIAEQRGYVIDDMADAALERNIKGAMKLPNFKHIYYVLDDLLEPAITNTANKASSKRRATEDDYTIIRQESFALNETGKSLDELYEELNSLTGLKGVKEQIKNQIQVQKTIQRAEREGKELPGNQGTLHMVFTGNAGTGKTVVARLVAAIYRELGVITKGQLVEVTRKDMISDIVGQTAKLVEDKVKEAMGGVLFIDEAYSVCKNDQDIYGQEAVDTLVPLLENHRKDFVCIMAGYTKDMDDFMTKNQGLSSRFPTTIEFEDYTLPELMSIFQGMVNNDGFIIEKRAFDAVKEIIGDQMRLPNFGNGRGVRSIYEKIVEKQKVRISQTTDWGENEQKILRLADVGDGAMAVSESYEDVMAELDALTGLASVKEQVRSMANVVKVNEDRVANGQTALDVGAKYMVFTGNPGTGKTTVARIIARIYKSMGILPSSRCVEVGKTDLVGQVVGETTKKTRKVIESAYGGVLFIDEAYQLIAEGNPYGKEALDELLTQMENHRDEFICIIAGYEKKIQSLLDYNEGFRSRFKNFIRFEDYTAEELMDIFKYNMKKEQLILEPEAEEAAKKLIESKCRIPDFGNARGVRNICDMIKMNMMNRIVLIPDKDDSIRNTIVKDDVTKMMGGEKIQDTSEILAELDSYIGLSNVKDYITVLAKSAQVNKKRREMGIDVGNSATLHMIFTGNAGTGKTSIARLIGKIYYSLGLIARSDVLETTQNDFIGQHVGETVPKTRATVNCAIGGVLFIDEAYSLMSNQFGHEAINELITLLENHKNDFVCILAGYSYEMEQFLKANSGLKSRFPETIEFEDYTLDELCEIFINIVKSKNYVVTQETLEKARAYIEARYQAKNFGNARGVRNIVDKITRQADSRICQIANPTTEDLITILPEDIF